MPNKDQIIKAAAAAVAGVGGTFAGGVGAGVVAGSAAAAAVDKIQKSTGKPK